MCLLMKVLIILLNGGKKKMDKITLELFEVGSCSQLEKVSLKSGQWKKVKFPALVGLIHHNKYGYILFDTGYSSVFTEETKSLSSKIYKLITPISFKKEDDLWVQLSDKGIKKEDISYCIISHYHADHIAGLKDLHHSTKIITYRPAYEHIRALKGIKALKEAFIPELLPENIEDRLLFLNKPKRLSEDLSPFVEGYDVLGDNSMYAIVLDGHAYQQIGLYIKPLNIFLCADAVWSSEAVLNHTPPMKVVKLIKNNHHNYLNNLEKMHLLSNNNKKIKIIPSHCEETLNSLKGSVISEP